MRNKIYCIFIILFLLLISLPFMGMLFYQNDGTREKRVLLDIHEVKGIASLNQFIIDNHAFRDKLSDLCMSFYVNILKESPIPAESILGKEDWMFLGNTYKDTHDASLGILNIDNSEVLSTYDNINSIQEFCDSINTDFYLIIAPNKETIYPEFLDLTPNKKPSLRMCIVEKLHADNRINLLDLTEYLRREKESNVLYYKADSHWNDLGGLLAAKEIVEFIHKDQNINLVEEDNFTIKKELRGDKIWAEYDISSMLNMEVTDTYFHVTNKRLPLIDEIILRERNGLPMLTYAKNEASSNKTKSIIVRDSYFAAMLQPFMSSIYEASMFIFFNKAEILEEIARTGKPDFILLVMVERNIDKIAIRENT